MVQTQYGKFADFCRDTGNRYATIPVCNLFLGSRARDNIGFGRNACDLHGISLSNNRHLANLGSIILSAAAILISAFLIYRSNRKVAAVGRKEMQIFLFGFMIISLCSIFTIGGFPLGGDVIKGFSAIHIGAVVATTWILMLCGLVNFQLLDDGTPMSIGLVSISALLFFIGSGYIALDTGFNFSGFWQDTISAPNRSYSLYTLYLLAPLIFLAVFVISQMYIVVGILKERRPLIYLLAAVLLFIIAQIFQFVISVHICRSTSGGVNGGMFETFFTLAAVVMVWTFWSSITEDSWPENPEA